MQIQDDPPLHLTYCLNIHPGETWEENFAAIRDKALAVKRALCPDKPFGLGLRISRAAAGTLSQPGECEKLRRFLDENGLYVFTVNGFPFGSFHGSVVKEDVYRPDWRSVERVEYTNMLTDILAKLLPDGVAGSISTVPGSYREWVTSRDDRVRIADNLSECAEHLDAIRKRTGKDICIALEPEPDCLIETTDDAIAFFDEFLRGESLRRRVGVCVDVCHQAVMFENPEDSIRKLVDAGIRVAKVQFSSALRVIPTKSALRALDEFSESVYLHQVKVRTASGEVISYKDMGEALNKRGTTAEATDEEWRVHFHVPLFVENYDELKSTNSLYTENLAQLIKSGATSHVEIETYTFDVLPRDLRRRDVVENVIMEYEWVLRYLGAR